MWRWVKSGVYSCKRLELWAKPPPIKLLCTYLMENLGGVGWVLPPYVFFDRLRKKRYYLGHTDIDLLQKLIFGIMDSSSFPEIKKQRCNVFNQRENLRILRISRVSWLIFSLQYFKVQYKLLMASVSNLQAQIVIQQITLDLFITKQLDARTTTCFSLTITKF